MESSLDSFEKEIGVNFKNKDLLKTAFIHRSYLNEHTGEKLPHNERLEFLGDAVLGLVVSKYLFENYPTHPEGDLTNFRSSIVNARMLSKASGALDLGKHLFLSKGEEATGGRNRQFILANTFESLIGALFLDQGLEAAKVFIEKYLIPYLPEIIEKRLYKDFKSQLQEISQEKLSETPTYKVLEENGPDHAKTFKIGVLVGDEVLGEGEGNSKQLAEQEAAKKALETWSKKS